MSIEQPPRIISYRKVSDASSIRQIVDIGGWWMGPGYHPGDGFSEPSDENEVFRCLQARKMAGEAGPRFLSHFRVELLGGNLVSGTPQLEGFDINWCMGITINEWQAAINRWTTGGYSPLPWQHWPINIDLFLQAASALQPFVPSTYNACSRRYYTFYPRSLLLNLNNSDCRQWVVSYINKATEHFKPDAISISGKFDQLANPQELMFVPEGGLNKTTGIINPNYYQLGMYTDTPFAVGQFELGLSQLIIDLYAAGYNVYTTTYPQISNYNAVWQGYSQEAQEKIEAEARYTRDL